MKSDLVKDTTPLEQLNPWDYIKVLSSNHIFMYPLKKGTKEPAIKAWNENATYDIGQLETWLKPDQNGNISYDVAMIPLKSGLITIDIDDPSEHANSTGMEWIKENERNGNRLHENKVAIERTKNNGLHYIYRYDLPNESIPTDLKISGVEVKNNSTIIYPSDSYKLITNSFLDNVCVLASDEMDVMPKWLKSSVNDAILKHEQNKRAKSEHNKGKSINQKAMQWVINFNEMLLNGIPEHERNERLTSVTGSLFHTGADNKTVWQQLQLINDKFVFPPLPNKELKGIFNSIAKRNHSIIKATELDDKAEQNQRNAQLAFNNNGNPRTNFATNFTNICEYDEHFKSSIKYNEFINSVVIKHGDTWKRWGDLDETRISIYIERKYTMTENVPRTMYQGIEEYALKNTFNPVKDLINIQQWDGKKRVDSLFIDYLGAEDNNYNRLVARKFMVGAVSRVFHPGIKFDLMPILTGKQGIGKSTLVSKLASGYFLDNLSKMDSSNKDDTMKLQDSWIIEVGELAPFKNSKTDNVKSFVSATTDIYRKPFGQANSIYKRHNVFIGTTNEQQFLSDKTGNRRYLTVECGVNEIKNKPIDISNNTLYQIYAEAKHLMEQGELLYLTPDEEKTANEQRTKNETYEPEDEAIKEYLNMKVPINWDDYDLFQRSSYYERVFQSNRYSSNEEDTTPLSQDELVPITAVATRELLSIPLNKLKNPSIQGTQQSLTKKISYTMSGLDEWKQSNKVKLFGRYVRGYKKK